MPDAGAEQEAEAIAHLHHGALPRARRGPPPGSERGFEQREGPAARDAQAVGHRVHGATAQERDGGQEPVAVSARNVGEHGGGRPIAPHDGQVLAALVGEAAGGGGERVGVVGQTELGLVPAQGPHLRSQRGLPAQGTGVWIGNHGSMHDGVP